jgi:hypothetical protein
VCRRVSQSAHWWGQHASSTKRSQIRSRPSSSASSSPPGSSGAGQPAARSSPRAASARPGPRRPWIWCTRAGESSAAAASVRIETPSARAEASAQARSRSACSRRHAAGRHPQQHPPSPSQIRRKRRGHQASLRSLTRPLTSPLPLPGLLGLAPGRDDAGPGLEQATEAMPCSSGMSVAAGIAAVVLGAFHGE